MFVKYATILKILNGDIMELCKTSSSELTNFSFNGLGMGINNKFALNKKFAVNFCNPTIKKAKIFKKCFPFYEVNTRGNTLSERQVHTKKFANINNHRMFDATEYPQVGLVPKL